MKKVLYIDGTLGDCFVSINTIGFHQPFFSKKYKNKVISHPNSGCHHKHSNAPMHFVLQDFCFPVKPVQVGV